MTLAVNMPKEYLHNLKAHWKIIVLGQVITILGTAAGAAQSELSFQCNLSAPSFSVGLFYIMLAFFLVPLYLEQRNKRQHMPVGTEEDGVDVEDRQLQANSIPQYRFLSVISLEAPPWFYMIMGGLDVYASYTFVLALKYTTITSISLLGSVSIASTMVLSYVFLHRSYTPIHLLGVFLCLLGIVSNVMVDFEDDQNGDESNAYPHKFRGDLLACMGGFLYGTNNVLGEVAVKNLGGPNEFLGMMGFFAAIIAFVQSFLFEREDIMDFTRGNECSTWTSSFLLVAFVLSNVLGYYGGARFLQLSDATFFSLCYQTGGLWSVLFSVFGEHIVPPVLFYVSMFIKVSGVVVYEMAPTPVMEEREPPVPDDVEECVEEPVQLQIIS